MMRMPCGTTRLTDHGTYSIIYRHEEETGKAADKSRTHHRYTGTPAAAKQSSSYLLAAVLEPQAAHSFQFHNT